MLNKIGNKQIVGIITNNNQVLSKISYFSNPINHNYFREEIIKKKWTFNLIDDITESVFTDEMLNEEDIKNIKLHLWGKYNIFYNHHGKLNKELAAEALKNAK